MSPVIIITPPPDPPLAGPASDTPPRLTDTYYQQLAAYCRAALDEIAAAVLPRLEGTVPTGASTASGHLNIPTPFLGTAITSVEQNPELQCVRLDVHRGRDTLQLMEAFRPIRDKVAAFDRDLVHVLNVRRSALAVEALDTYAIAKSLAHAHNNPALLAWVGTMQRALGRRGPRKKKPVSPQS